MCSFEGLSYILLAAFNHQRGSLSTWHGRVVLLAVNITKYVAFAEDLTKYSFQIRYDLSDIICVLQNTPHWCCHGAEVPTLIPWLDSKAMLKCLTTQWTNRCIISPSYPEPNHYLINGLPEYGARSSIWESLSIISWSEKKGIEGTFLS